MFRSGTRGEFRPVAKSCSKIWRHDAESLCGFRYVEIVAELAESFGRQTMKTARGAASCLSIEFECTTSLLLNA